MIKYNLGILFSFLIVFNSCTEDYSNEVPEKPKLLFSSGFEGGVYIDQTIDEYAEDYRFIRGTDSETGYSWPIDILGSSSYSGLHYIADDNHQAINAEIQTVIGHNGDATRALFQLENYEYRDDTQCPYEILDILDRDGLRSIVKKYNIDGIVNLAAILSAVGEEHPMLAWDVNMNGLINVFEVAKDEKVKTILTPSSIAVFGPETPSKDTPQETILRPKTMYGITKVAGELLGDY